MNELRYEFGRRVQWIRLQLGLTQEAVAERGQLSADTVRRIEVGHSSPSLDSMVKVAAGLCVPLGVLIGDLGEQPLSLEERVLVAVVRARSVPPRFLTALAVACSNVPCGWPAYGPELADPLRSTSEPAGQWTDLGAWFRRVVVPHVLVDESADEGGEDDGG